MLASILKGEGCQRKLFHVVGATSPPGSFTGLLNGGQQQADEHTDDRDHHQQFDEGKAGHMATAMLVTAAILPSEKERIHDYSI